MFKLHIQFVDKKTKEPIKTDEKMAVICGAGGYTCWAQICVTARGRIIKEYPYAAYMAHVPILVGVDAAYISTVLASTTAFAVDTFPVIDKSFVANLGLDYRRGLTQNSQILECLAKAFIPPLMTDCFIPSECNWTIEVQLNSNEFCAIYEPDPPDDKLEVELHLLKAELLVNMVELTQSAKEMVNRQLAGSPQKLQIPFMDYEIINLSIPASQAEFTTVTNIMRHPRRLYAVLVAEADFMGKINSTPLYYRNLNLSKFELTVNGQTHTVNCNFPQQTFLEGYQGMVHAMSVANRGLALNRSIWSGAQTVWVFDLTAANLAGCLDLISAPSEFASWNIRIEFREKLDFNVNMIVILEKEAIMEIDKDYNVNIL